MKEVSSIKTFTQNVTNIPSHLWKITFYLIWIMLLTCGGGIGITACISGGGAARKQRILYCVEPRVHNHKWIPQNLYRAKPLGHSHKKNSKYFSHEIETGTGNFWRKALWINYLKKKSYCRLFQQLTSKLHVWHGHRRRHCRNPGNHRRSPRVRHHHETNTKRDTTYQYLGWKAYFCAQYC